MKNIKQLQHTGQQDLSKNEYLKLLKMYYTNKNQLVEYLIKKVNI